LKNKRNWRELVPFFHKVEQKILYNDLLNYIFNRSSFKSFLKRKLQNRKIKDGSWEKTPASFIIPKESNQKPTTLHASGLAIADADEWAGDFRQAQSPRRARRPRRGGGIGDGGGEGEVW
jgi:hypothetical protein